MARWVLQTGWIWALALVATTASAQIPPASLFARHCAGCHADDGSGAPAAAAAPDFRDCNATSRSADGDLADAVRYGGGLPTLHPEKPAYGHVFDDKTVEALVAYIRAFCVEHPKRVYARMTRIQPNSSQLRLLPR